MTAMSHPVLPTDHSCRERELRLSLALNRKVKNAVNETNPIRAPPHSVSKPTEENRREKRGRAIETKRQVFLQMTRTTFAYIIQAMDSQEESPPRTDGQRERIPHEKHTATFL
jgi:hypothetical protein